MKATELMIGDWVNVPMAKLTARIDSILSKREAHNDACIVIDFNGQGFLAHYTENDIESIPLTAEILEKNGFYYEHDYGIFYRSILGDYAKDKEPVVCVGWNSKMEMCGYDICSGTGRICAGHNALYVHQLQHALRLCGLTELADNFQI